MSIFSKHCKKHFNFASLELATGILAVNYAAAFSNRYSKPVICGDVPTSPDEFETVCFTYLVGHHEWVRSEYLPVSRGPMTATTIYQSQDDESGGGLLLSGGFTNTQVCPFRSFTHTL